MLAAICFVAVFSVGLAQPYPPGYAYQLGNDWRVNPDGTCNGYDGKIHKRYTKWDETRGGIDFRCHCHDKDEESLGILFDESLSPLPLSDSPAKKYSQNAADAPPEVSCTRRGCVDQSGGHVDVGSSYLWTKDGVPHSCTCVISEDAPVKSEITDFYIKCLPAKK